MKSPRFLEYIETTGEQYIDTGILISSYAGIDMDYKLTQQSRNYDTIFGTRNGNVQRFTARYGNATNGELQMQFSSYANSTYEYWNTGLRKNTDVNGWISVQLDGYVVNPGAMVAATGFIAYREGDTLPARTHEFQRGTSTPYAASLYLCALHDAEAGAVDFAYMQLKPCAIYDIDKARIDNAANNASRYMKKLVRAFFPALDEDGRACLYDAVSDSYFYSPNGNEFIAGPRVMQMLFRVTSRDVGYTPEYRLRSVNAVGVPNSAFYPGSAGYVHPDNGLYNPLYEFVGYDTDEQAFTAVYATRAYREGGAQLDLRLVLENLVVFPAGIACGLLYPGQNAL